MANFSIGVYDFARWNVFYEQILNKGIGGVEVTNDNLDGKVA